DDRSDPESYMDKWTRWIENDWYRSYVLKLGKLGLNFPPEMFDRAKSRLERGMVHKNMLGSAAFWMLHFWRTDGLGERDFEWLESKYRVGMQSTAPRGRRSARPGTTHSSSS